MQRTINLACGCTKTEMDMRHNQLALLIYIAVYSEKEMKCRKEATFG